MLVLLCFVSYLLAENDVDWRWMVDATGQTWQTNAKSYG